MRILKEEHAIGSKVHLSQYSISGTGQEQRTRIILPGNSQVMEVMQIFGLLFFFFFFPFYSSIPQEQQVNKNKNKTKQKQKRR